MERVDLDHWMSTTGPESRCLANDITVASYALFPRTARGRVVVKQLLMLNNFIHTDLIVISIVTTHSSVPQINISPLLYKTQQSNLESFNEDILEFANDF